MATKGRLGRGLSALIPAAAGREETDLRQIHISEIKPNPNQPRKDFEQDSFEELVATVREVGLIQPIVIRKKENNFEIIAGERRWRAAQKAGLKTVPCVVKEASEVVSLQLAVIENIQRQDLNPIEEATAFNYLLNDGGLKQEQLAKKLGRSRPYITNTVRLLRLPEKIREMLVSGQLTAGHAKAIAALSDEKTQTSLAKRVVSSGMSVRETERFVDSLWHDVKPKKNKNGSREHGELSNILGARVVVKDNNGKGVLSIYYENKKQFNDLIKKITRAGGRSGN